MVASVVNRNQHCRLLLLLLLQVVSDAVTIYSSVSILCDERLIMSQRQTLQGTDTSPSIVVCSDLLGDLSSF